MSSHGQAFCKDCGTELHGAKFCPECGAATENTPASAVSRSGSPTETSHERSARHGARWLIAGGIGVLAVIALVGALLLATRGGPAPASSYVPRARRTISPVLQANRHLTSSLRTLSASADPTTARSAVKEAIGTTASARRSLGRLRPSAANRAFASDAAQALALELTWLKAADSVLRNSQSPMLTQLSGLGAQTQAKLQAIDDEVPGASSSYPGSAKLVSYAQARTHAASSAAALRQFSDQVQSLLTQSTPAYRQINCFHLPGMPVVNRS